MPKVEYFLLCESVAVDQDTNRISLFNVLEDFQIAPPKDAAQKPAYILGQFVAVALFNREPDDGDKEFEACLRFKLPDDQYSEHKISFRMERNRQRVLMRFVGMPPVGKHGVLQFELLLDGAHRAFHTVYLNTETSVS
ncbi:MAG: hypothetical protein ABL888_06800 [Pirellulaceae bacterium]